MKRRRLLLLLCLAVAGCTSVSLARRQAASNAVAGAEAIESATTPPVSTVAAGVKDNIHAAMVGEELPPPQIPVQEVIPRADEYREEAAKLRATIKRIGFWAKLGAAVAGLGLLAARFVPGPWGKVGVWALKQYSPKIREIDEKAQDHAKQVQLLFETIRSVEAGREALKELDQRFLTEEVVATIRRHSGGEAENMEQFMAWVLETVQSEAGVQDQIAALRKAVLGGADEQ